MASKPKAEITLKRDTALKGMQNVAPSSAPVPIEEAIEGHEKLQDMKAKAARKRAAGPATIRKAEKVKDAASSASVRDLARRVSVLETAIGSALNVDLTEFEEGKI